MDFDRSRRADLQELFESSRRDFLALILAGLRSRCQLDRVALDRGLGA